MLELGTIGRWLISFPPLRKRKLHGPNSMQKSLLRPEMEAIQSAAFLLYSDWFG
jgi:hypothetical protein